MAKVYRYLVLALAIALVSGVAAFYIGRTAGYDKGVFEAGVVAASTDALRTQRLIELLDAGKTSDAQLRLNLYLDEKLIELDTLTRSPVGRTSSAIESFNHIKTYRQSHPFVNPAGPEVTERLRSILGPESTK